MDIKKAFANFISFHEIRKTSVHTIRNYRNDIGAFVEWIGAVHDVHDTDIMQLMHLRDWVLHLQKTPGRYGRLLADVTVHQRSLHVSVFCHWLEQEGVIEKPISTRFQLPTFEQKFIPTFTPEDVEKMLDACDEGYKNSTHLRKSLTSRNRAMVSVLIDTGIRRSELSKLRLCDVDRDLRVLLVHRKGNKWQQVPISREGFKPLHEYLTKYRPILAREAGRTKALKEDAVFLTGSGEPISIEGISSLFVRIRKRTGIDDKRVSPHNCRRYMATSQLAAGRSPLDVQRQMGHTTLTMTNRYASLSVEQLQRSHEEFSPLRRRSSTEKQDIQKTGYWDE